MEISNNRVRFTPSEAQWIEANRRRVPSGVGQRVLLARIAVARQQLENNPVMLRQLEDEWRQVQTFEEAVDKIIFHLSLVGVERSYGTSPNGQETQLSNEEMVGLHATAEALNRSTRSATLRGPEPIGDSVLQELKAVFGVEGDQVVEDAGDSVAFALDLENMQVTSGIIDAINTHLHPSQ